MNKEYIFEAERVGGGLVQGYYKKVLLWNPKKGEYIEHQISTIIKDPLKVQNRINEYWEVKPETIRLIQAPELEKLKLENEQKTIYYNELLSSYEKMTKEAQNHKQRTEKAEKIVEDLKIYYKHFAQYEFNGSFLASEILNKIQEFENGR